MQQRKRFNTGLGTDRVRHLAQHGSSARGVSVRRANPIFRTRGVLRLNTDRAEGVALVLVGFARGVFLRFARGVQFGTGHIHFCTGRVISLLLR